MAASPYVRERQSEYWTSIGLERFFSDLGFEITSYPIQALTEGNWPSDFLFYDKTNSKIFGFQYKALYRNGADHWPLKKTQHRNLRRFPWMYYCLSELRNLKDHAVALHLARIVPSDFEYTSRVPFSNQRPRYMRMGAFYRGLVDCRYGVRVETITDLLHALRVDTENELPRDLIDLVQVVAIELRGRRALFFKKIDDQG